jgi:O-antigen/teichoic acid export membrane protein
MSVSNPSEVSVSVPPLGPARVLSRIKSWISDRGDDAGAQRMAGSAFLIRVASSGVVFGSQIVFARWMGGFEYGVFVYAWTWLLLVGEIIHLGMPMAAQRFIPQYTTRGELDLLRGFLVASRRLVLGISSAFALIAAAAIYLLSSHIGADQAVPLYLTCAATPAFALSILFDGTARSYNWVNLALLPHFFARPCVVIALLAGMRIAGWPIDATTAMACVVVAAWATVIGQFAVLARRLRGQVPAGPKAYVIRTWLGTALPIILVWSFYTLLTFTDVIVLQQFRAPEEVGVYYAASKTLMRCHSCISRWRHRSRIVSPPFTSLATAPASRRWWQNRSAGRSGRRHWRPS